MSQKYCSDSLGGYLMSNENKYITVRIPVDSYRNLKKISKCTHLAINSIIVMGLLKKYTGEDKTWKKK